MLPKLYLPNPDGSGNKVEVEHNGTVVMVGANGAGKSRLGAWIERNTGAETIVHRISAQRALEIPDFATVKTSQQSLNELIWGHENSQYANLQYKLHHRWKNSFETSSQDDYGKVLSTLFAKSSDRDRMHTEETKKLQAYIPVSDAPIEILTKLWNEILPHRQISLIDGTVKVGNSKDDTTYLGKEMSDGEKVALYLMGQCLVAPAQSIFIVDEPEIHLHTSIMQSLWNKLEEAKPDCLFIYITHDLNFASTRVSATNIWIKEYDGKSCWNWQLAPDNQELPESLILELIGSRKTIIFVEGEKGGKDHAIYQSIFKTYNIVPRNGCQKVIDSVKSMRSNSDFHHLTVYGIIDRDYRTDQEILGLKALGVHTIDVAEIENILLNEATLTMVAVNQHLDPVDTITKALTIAKDLLSRDIEHQISLRTCRALENSLSRIDNKTIGLSNIQSMAAKMLEPSEIEKLYTQNNILYTALLTSDNLDEILKHFNHKGLLPNICAAFELGKNGYEKLVLRMLNSDQREEIIQGFTKYVPSL
ncbi:DUF4435 domain-containing protein [Pseudomonas viridiflava]|uniref:DUF4435 domain-containing protein n=1 Tax=Pseudomonas viridiflava TaxID=33069 RepID=UPI000F04C9A3|nr:DUF4435 domain-containing protein [Pseudomonas viridiflava]